MKFFAHLPAASLRATILSLTLLSPSLPISTRAASSVVAWGDNQYGQTNVPPDLTNVVAVAGGGRHSLALRRDGTVVAWGDSSDGRTSVPAGLSDVVSIAAGWAHSLALRLDGTVVAWGGSEYGQTSVPPDLTNAVAIAAGSVHCVALRKDGTVVAWGDNYYGQTSVPAGLNNVVAISAGYGHSLALRADGTALGWGMYQGWEWFWPIMGDDFFGRPVGLTNIVTIASAGQDLFALKASGNVYVWGDDHLGQFLVPSNLTNVAAIAAGAYHLLALQADGAVAAWGLNGSGQANVPPELGTVATVAAGAFHSLALVSEGPPAVTSILANRRVAQGVGDVFFYVSVVGDLPLKYQWQCNGTNVPGATDRWLVLSGGLPSQDGLYSVTVSNAWGTASSAPARLTVVPAVFTQPPVDQVKYLGGTAAFEIQVQASGPLLYQWRCNGEALPGETNATLAVQGIEWAQQGNRYSLLVSNGFGAVLSPEARLQIVNVAAWGNNFDTDQIYKGQATVPSDFTNIVAVEGGGYHSLALRADGRLVAWGDNYAGQTDVPAGLGNPIAIAAGYAHSLALRSDGTVAAWGLNNHGQIDVPAGLSDVVAIAAGEFHSLALRSDGTVVRWGSGTNLPQGSTNVVAIAAGLEYGDLMLRADGTVAALGISNVMAVAEGYSHCLALREDGTVVAWGSNLVGQTNVPPGLSDVRAIAAGNAHSLALRADGTVVAWGQGDLEQTTVPPDLGNVLAVGCGGWHSLAIVGASPLAHNVALVNPLLSSGVFSVSVATRYGRVYALEFKNSLNDRNWTALPLVSGNGGLKTLTDPAATSASRFYRVRHW